jgi:hypothetical protein
LEEWSNEKSHPYAMKDVRSLLKLTILEIDTTIAKRHQSYIWYGVAAASFLWFALSFVNDPWRSAWSSFGTLALIAFVGFIAWGAATTATWIPGTHERLPATKEKFIFAKAHDLIRFCGPEHFEALVNELEHGYLPKTEGFTLLKAEMRS